MQSHRYLSEWVCRCKFKRCTDQRLRRDVISTSVKNDSERVVDLNFVLQSSTNKIRTFHWLMPLCYDAVVHRYGALITRENSWDTISFRVSIVLQVLA